MPAFPIPFGLLLVTLLPFLFFPLLLSLYLAISFGIYGLFFLGSFSSVPIALLAGLAIVVFGTAFGFIMGIYRLFCPPRIRTLGVCVSTEEQPEIWRLARDVASDVGIRPVDRIMITPDSGVCVYQEGLLPLVLFGGGRRILQIGIPSIHALSVEELRSILAHEYGHFSNRDTQWFSFTYAMANGLVAAFQATPGLKLRADGEWSLVGIVTALNPGYWTLCLFLKLLFFVSQAFSRLREVLADQWSMQLYGGEPFKSGLAKLAFNDVVFSEWVEGDILPAMIKEKRLISDFSMTMETAKTSLSDEDRQQIRTYVLAQESSCYDSHPQIADRLKYSERFGTGKMAGDARDGSLLFRDWAVLNQKMAGLYNERLLI